MTSILNVKLMHLSLYHNELSAAILYFPTIVQTFPTGCMFIFLLYIVSQRSGLVSGNPVRQPLSEGGWLLARFLFVKKHSDGVKYKGIPAHAGAGFTDRKGGFT